MPKTHFSHPFVFKLKEDLPPLEEVMEAWRVIYDAEPEVDPDCVYDWETLAIGFLLGLGFEAEQACDIASKFPLH